MQGPYRFFGDVHGVTQIQMQDGQYLKKFDVKNPNNIILAEAQDQNRFRYNIESSPLTSFSIEGQRQYPDLNQHACPQNLRASAGLGLRLNEYCEVL
jgi:hypothetical protein